MHGREATPAPQVPRSAARTPGRGIPHAFGPVGGRAYAIRPGPAEDQGRGGIGLWGTEVELGLFRTMVMTRSVSCNGLAAGSS